MQCKRQISRFDTFVMPPFNWHEMAQKSNPETGHKRKINKKVVRHMVEYSHGMYRSRLKQMAFNMNKEYVQVTEEYTTKCCPMCVKCRPSFSGKVFNCTNPQCQYTASRDWKSPLTLLVKCLKPDCREIFAAMPNISGVQHNMNIG